VKISVVQHDIAWEDGPATRERLRPLVAQAAAAGSRLVALTEMYATGFSMATDRIAEEPGGPNEAFCVAQAREHGVWLAASVSQREPGSASGAGVPHGSGAGVPRGHSGAGVPRGHSGAGVPRGHSGAGVPQNTARARNVGLLVSPAGQVHRYAKIHPFSYADENKYYEAGDKTLTVDVEGLRVSLLICYDLRFADTFWGLAGETDCYLVVANWPQPRREHWRALLVARAIENQAYVVGANRVGLAPKDLSYSGDSRIVDPLGTVLAEAAYVETVLTADVEPQRVAQVRRDLPFLADRT
jgi:omega-amidase